MFILIKQKRRDFIQTMNSLPFCDQRCLIENQKVFPLKNETLLFFEVDLHFILIIFTIFFYLSINAWEKMTSNKYFYYLFNYFFIEGSNPLLF